MSKITKRYPRSCAPCFKLRKFNHSRDQDYPLSCTSSGCVLQLCFISICQSKEFRLQDITLSKFNYVPCNSLDRDYPPSCTPSGHILERCKKSSVSVHLLLRSPLYPPNV